MLARFSRLLGLLLEQKVTIKPGTKEYILGPAELELFQLLIFFLAACLRLMIRCRRKRKARKDSIWVCFTSLLLSAISEGMVGSLGAPSNYQLGIKILINKLDQIHSAN